MADIKALHVYAGGPVTARGEASRLGTDPTGLTDDIAYASGRVAVVRSTTDPLKCAVFSMHTHPVSVVKISPDGNTVASGDEGGFVRVWDRQTLKQKVAEQVYGGAVCDLSVTDDGKFSVVVGDARGMFAKTIKLPSAGSAGVCGGHSKRVICCDVSPSKPAMTVTGSEDMSIGIFKGPPVREIDTPKFMRHHTGFVNDVKFSPDGTKIAVGSSDRTISIVDVASFEVEKTLSGHEASVTAVSWSKDGKQLLSSANDKSTILWDVKEGSVAKKSTFGKNVMDMQVACAILPKTGRFASVALSGDISLMGADADEPEMVLRGHAKQIVGLTVVNGVAYSADYSGRMVPWDVGSGPSKKYFSGKGPSTGVSAIAANDKMIVNVGMDGKIFATPLDSLEYAKPLTLKGGASDVAMPASGSDYLAAVINETRVAIVSNDGTEFVAEMQLDRSDKGVCVAVTQDGSRLAIGVEVAGGAGEYRMLKFSGGSLEQEGESVRVLSAPNRLAFSPDGKILAIGEKSRRVKMVSTEDGSKVDGGGTGHTARIDALKFSADGKRLASGGMDGSIAVWYVDSDEDSQRIQGAHRNGVTGIAFIDDGSILSAGSDSCLRSWKL